MPILTFWGWTPSGASARADLAFRNGKKGAFSGAPGRVKKLSTISSNGASAHDAAGNLTLAPKTWTFQGSDDGADWTQLDSQSNVTNWTAAYNEYHFANETAYRHYRLRITANNNNNAGCVCVAEMDLEGPLVGEDFRYDLEVTHQAGTTGRAAEAPDADAKEVVVTVTGISAHSYDEARGDALRNAVKQGAGETLTSLTRVERGVLLGDTIISRAAGYVRGYDVLGKAEDNGVYRVEVRATVARGKIADDLAAVQMLIRQVGWPNLVIHVEVAPGGPLVSGDAAEAKLMLRETRLRHR